MIWLRARLSGPGTLLIAAVFWITGTAMVRSAQRAGLAPTVQNGVRVYACSDRNLTGAVDRERAERMRLRYSAAC